MTSAFTWASKRAKFSWKRAASARGVRGFGKVRELYTPPVESFCIAAV